LKTTLSTKGETTATMDRRALSSPAGKSLVPLAREDARLDPFLGCTIRKIFGSQWYHGQVIAIDVDVASGDRAYHIAYEDGDEEHLSSSEVKNFLVMASRSAPPSEAGSPRRSVVPSHRPSIARTEVSAPRPSVAPSISQPAAFLGAAAAPVPFVPFSTGIDTHGIGGHGHVDHPRITGITFWGPMLLAGITGAMMVALVSSFMSFIMDGELDGGERGPIPMGLVAPLPPWAEAETQIFAKVGPGGGNGPMVEDVNLLSLKDDFFQEKLPEVLNEPQSSQPVEKILEDGQQSSTTSFSEAFGDHKVEEIPVPQMPPTEAEDVEDETHQDVPGNQLIDSQMALEEDLSVAVAAVMEASGLVVRVVAKSFFRSLEEVWLSILSSFSSSLAASFTGSEDSEMIEPPLPPTPEPEEAAGALQSLMTTILVSLAGVVTILVSIHPPPSVAQELKDAVHIHEAKSVVLPCQAPSPRPSPAAPFPSPVPIAPLEQMQKAQVRQILESVNTPARAKSLGGRPEVMATPLKSGTGGARSLMSIMGRTPPVGATLPVAIQSERRLPPPPASLTVGNENVPPRNQETCARCMSSMPADANFCRYCGQQRGKKVMQVKPAAPMPTVPTVPIHAVRGSTAQRESSRELREGGRTKANLIVEKPRFRYGSGLKKLKEMGYGDTEEVRDILTKCSGDLSAALRMINGSSPRRRA